jgi:hypothetical protein
MGVPEVVAALSEELAGFSGRLVEDSVSFAQELALARSLPELIEIQTRQLATVADAWSRHAVRMREIWLSTLRP